MLGFNYKNKIIKGENSLTSLGIAHDFLRYQKIKYLGINYCDEPNMGDDVRFTNANGQIIGLQITHLFDKETAELNIKRDDLSKKLIQYLKNKISKINNSFIIYINCRDHDFTKITRLKKNIEKELIKEIHNKDNIKKLPSKDWPKRDIEIENELKSKDFLIEKYEKNNADLFIEIKTSHSGIIFKEKKENIFKNILDKKIKSKSKILLIYCLESYWFDIDNELIKSYKKYVKSLKNKFLYIKEIYLMEYNSYKNIKIAPLNIPGNLDNIYRLL